MKVKDVFNDLSLAKSGLDGMMVKQRSLRSMRRLKGRWWGGGMICYGGGDGQRFERGAGASVGPVAARSCCGAAQQDIFMLLRREPFLKGD